jgi:hypothetical protein
VFTNALVGGSGYSVGPPCFELCQQREKNFTKINTGSRARCPFKGERNK